MGILIKCQQLAPFEVNHSHWSSKLNFQSQHQNQLHFFKPTVAFLHMEYFHNRFWTKKCTYGLVYNLCSCINIAQNFPVCCSVNSVDGCCRVKRCPQLFLSVPHYFETHWALGLFWTPQFFSQAGSKDCRLLIANHAVTFSLWLTKA